MINDYKGKNKMDVKFRISSAGIAGDLHKLLIIEYENSSLSQLFNEKYFWSLRRAKKILLRKVELLTGRTPKEI